MIKPKKLTPNDYEFLFKTAKKTFGITTTTITGGEPLLRTDVEDIAKKIFMCDGKITLVTNGYFLNENLSLLNYINTLNISLHTLDKYKYSEIVKRENTLDKVIHGIMSIRELYPHIDICLNVAITKGINDTNETFLPLVEFAKSIRASIKAIQLFPTDCPGFIPIDNIRNIIYNTGFIETFSKTRKQCYTDGKMTISLTKIFCANAIDSNEPSKYCKNNNDLFVSPDGTIKPCRQNENEINLFPEISSRNEFKLSESLKLCFNTLGNYC